MSDEQAIIGSVSVRNASITLCPGTRSQCPFANPETVDRRQKEGMAYTVFLIYKVKYLLMVKTITVVTWNV